MKKLIGFVLFIALIIFLHTSCPDKDQHTEALSESIAQMLGEKFNHSGLDNIITDSPELQSFIQDLGYALVNVDDYFLFSIGKINLTGEEQVVSIGIGGHVFTFNDKIVQQGAAIMHKGNELLQNLKEKL